MGRGKPHGRNPPLTESTGATEKKKKTNRNLNPRGRNWRRLLTKKTGVPNRLTVSGDTHHQQASNGAKTGGKEGGKRRLGGRKGPLWEPGVEKTQKKKKKKKQ